MTQPILSESLEQPDTRRPHVSFSAYPLGAFLVCLCIVIAFYSLSHNEDKSALTQIMIAACLTICTVGGVLYALMLLAFKRFPSFFRSFFAGALTALLTFMTARMVAYYNPQWALLLVLGFVVLSAMVAVLMPRLKSS